MTAGSYAIAIVFGILCCLTVGAVIDAVRVWRETRSPRTTRQQLDKQLDITEALRRGNRKVR